MVPTMVERKALLKVAWKAVMMDVMMVEQKVVQMALSLVVLKVRSLAVQKVGRKVDP